MGQLVFQATAGGQTALVGPNPSTNFSLNVPAVNGTLITSGDTATVTNTMISGPVSVAKGGTGSTTSTGSGSVVLQTSPTFVTPTLGAATATSLTFADGSTQVSHAVPQTIVYASGSGTYTVPANAKYLYIKMVGGGGGGAGGNNGGVGGNGGNTTFGSSFLTAGGGTGGVTAANGLVGYGGTATIGAGATGISLTGGQGGAGTGQGATTTGYQVASSGGNSAFGGGAGGQENQAGANGAANTGAGGAGGASGGTIANVGGGGGAGGYIEAYITTSLAASYSVAIGAGGTGGTAGTSAFAGGTGAAGLIIVTAFF